MLALIMPTNSSIPPPLKKFNYNEAASYLRTGALVCRAQPSTAAD